MFEPERILSSLDYYKVHFLVGESYPGFEQPLAPPALLAGLAVQSDARMRLALIAVLLFMLGGQLVAMGLLGEVIVRTYHESQGKPIYVIAKTLNLRPGYCPGGPNML